MLESVCHLDIPAGLRWELIVVDNGAGDASGVAGRFAGRIPIRCVREPRPGQSNARNRGVAEARGDYLCWTDDDVEVDSGWLAAYWRAFQRHPEAGLFGGRVMPVPEAPTPGWFDRCLDDWPLAAVTAKRDAAVIAPIHRLELPWGANFAIRTAEQKLLAYDPELGISPERPRMADETDLLFRLLKRGATGWWVPDSLVRHRIDQPRQSRAYLLAYFRRAGDTAAYLHRHRTGDNAHEVDGRKSWPARYRATLQLVSLAALVISQLARVIGHDRLSLRMLARHGLCRGILQFDRRSDRQGSGRLQPKGALP
jgi:glycosyltransferase involved in cell wall biosynthesis